MIAAVLLLFYGLVKDRVKIGMKTIRKECAILHPV